MLSGLRNFLLTVFSATALCDVCAQDAMLPPPPALQAQAVVENIAQHPPENSDIIVIDKSINWTNKADPEKSDKNLIRIKFGKSSVALSKDDKLALNSMLRLANQDNVRLFKVKSFATMEETPQKTRQKALLRILKLKEELTKAGLDFANKTELSIFPSLSKVGSDYIDIDKN